MKRRLEFTVTPETAGKTVRRFLQEELSFSGHQISRLKFQEEGIRVDGKKVYVSHVLREGEVLTVGLTEQVLRRDTEGGRPGKIWDLIVNKPAGMVCHPSPGHFSDTLANQAAAHLGGTGTAMDMRVTGRLDKDTSGIVTFARNSEAAAMIQRQREDGRLVKIYLALAEGRFEQPEGTVDCPLRREAPGSPRMICAPEAETEDSEGKPRTLLACRIEHGRTHQIRVHMASIGHPLAGDPLYGNGNGQETMGLHAFRLSFQKPFGQGRIEITAESPDWAAFYKGGIFGKPFV